MKAAFLLLLFFVTVAAISQLSQTAFAWPGEPQRGLKAPLLSFEQRIAYQRAIENVYWGHRLWPKENPSPKPSLDDVMPLSVVQKKVVDYMEESNAIAKYRGHDFTGQELQAEMQRIAASTKRPDQLQEIWKALGNDPYVIAECLARPLLANRIIHQMYLQDTEFHAEVRQRARVEASRLSRPDQMRLTSGEYTVSTWAVPRKGKGLPSAASSRRGVAELSRSAWTEMLRNLACLFSPVPKLIPTDPLWNRIALRNREIVPVGVVSALQEDDTRFYVVSVIKKSKYRIRLAIVSWEKDPFDAWWGRQKKQTDLQEPGFNYVLPTITSDTCTQNEWRPTEAAPTPRSFHTSIWTGAEMIIWGGYDGTYLDTGARYDPSTDTWNAVSSNGAPVPRTGHTAVWTGSEMIVWGGTDGAENSYLNTGGAYNPSTDGWRSTTETSGPTARASQTAIWTGTEMMIWGGYGCIDSSCLLKNYLNTGSRYDPQADAWTPLSTLNAPTSRMDQTAVWTGTQMIVWGGFGCIDQTCKLDDFLNTGGRFDPSTNIWQTLSTVNAPGAQILHTAVWTGTYMIVWGGILSSNSGGRYDPSGDTWQPMSQTNAPAERYWHSAVWTGTEMIVWGGISLAMATNTGGRYDPVSDSWQPTSVSDAPAGRYQHTAVWTGTQMIVFGGSLPPSITNTGGKYDPVSDSWTSTLAPVLPTVRHGHTTVWTGAEMIVWGGFSTVELDSGSRYDPTLDTWTDTTTNGAPSARDGHTAIWTGTEMIVWGGYNAGYLNDGSHYSPLSDTWQPTGTVSRPSSRTLHEAVWTGSKMIIWGGYGATDSGGRYDPTTRRWQALSSRGAPVGDRRSHKAIWTGKEMIVWGGVDPSHGGARYNPLDDSWRSIREQGQPEQRYGFSAVWTGSEMLVWGGEFNSIYLRAGGRYSPQADQWRPMIAIGLPPSARANHTAIWTGSKMIVWGGYGCVDASCSELNALRSGGEYDPDVRMLGNPIGARWTMTNLTGAASPRSGHTAIWSGTEMIVWGGFTNTGARYCPEIP